MQHHVLPLKAEPVVTEAKEVLKLVDIKPVTTNIPASMSRKTLNDPDDQVYSPVTALETINKEETKEKAVDKLVFVSVKKGEIEYFGKKEILTEAEALKSVKMARTAPSIMFLK